MFEEGLGLSNPDMMLRFIPKIISSWNNYQQILSCSPNESVSPASLSNSSRIPRGAIGPSLDRGLAAPKAPIKAVPFCLGSDIPARRDLIRARRKEHAVWDLGTRKERKVSGTRARKECCGRSRTAEAVLRLQSEFCVEKGSESLRQGKQNAATLSDGFLWRYFSISFEFDAIVPDALW